MGMADTEREVFVQQQQLGAGACPTARSSGNRHDVLSWQLTALMTWHFARRQAENQWRPKERKQQACLPSPQSLSLSPSL